MTQGKKISEEEQNKLNLVNEIKDINYRIKHGILRTPPKHRKFKVSERVQYGAHKETYIRKIFENGLYYTIESIDVKRSSDLPASNEKRVIEWHEILPIKIKNTTFAKKEKYYIHQHNATISALIMKVNHAGVDMEVPYQREHVWKKKNKIELIDSIFNNIDIGKFVFIQRDYGFDGSLFEILDGKQRLTTLNDFYEDRFKYNGFYYSELSYLDKYKFLNHNISYGYLVNPDKEGIFKTFIKLNTCGKPMANKHINHVKKLLDEL